MEEQKSTITAGQLFSLLYVGRLVILITINTVLTGGSRMTDSLLSCALAFVLNFVLILPIYLLHKRHPEKDILDYAYDVSKIVGLISAVLYTLYFVIVDCYYMSFFEIFFTNVLDETLPLWLIAAGVMVVAVYAALRGVQAVARTSGIVMIAMIAGLLFIIGALLPGMKPVHFDPPLYDGPKQMILGTLLFLGRSTGFASISLLMPRVKSKGSGKLPFALWNMVVYTLMAGLITAMVGALGQYMNQQIFPVYTASQMAVVGVIENLDAVFSGIWISGLFIKISIDLYLMSHCMSKALNKRAGKITIFAGAAVISLLSIFISKSHRLQSVFYGVFLLFPLTAAAAFLIPLALLLYHVRKEKKEKRKLFSRRKAPQPR